MAFVVSYTYSFEDYLALIHAKRAMGMFRGVGGVVHYILAAIAFLLVLGGLTDWSNDLLADLVAPQSLAILLGGIVGVCGLIALIDFLFERVYRLIFRRYALANADLSLTVDEDGIRWSAKGIAGNLGWSLVRRVYLGKDHVFVFISKVEGLGFPRRGVPTEAAFDELVSFLRSRIASRRPGPSQREHGHERGPDDLQVLPVSRELWQIVVRLERPSAPPQRQLRVGELIRRAMADILPRGEIHDPALEGMVVTVPEVRVTPDLKLATIFLMPLGGKGADTVVATFERTRNPCAARSRIGSISATRPTFASSSTFIRGG